MAAQGDPATTAGGSYFLPRTCKWNVTEVRSGTVLSPTYGQYGQTSVYVTVDYPLNESTPMSGNYFLKQIMLNFTIYSGTQLIMNVFKVDGADVICKTVSRICGFFFGR